MNLHINKSFSVLGIVLLANMALAQSSNVSTEAPQLPLRQLTGLALAEQTAEVSTIVSQRMNEVHVEEGQRVKKGQLLATLEYSVSKAEFEAANAIAKDESSVNVAIIEARESRDRLVRFQQAVQNGVSNPMELEIAKNEFNKSMAVLKREKSRLVSAAKAAETAKARQEAYFVRAPFDGIVCEQHVQPGNMVENGQVIFTIVAPSRLRAELNLPVDLFGSLKQGNVYEVEAGQPVGQTLQARLKFVSPAIDSASQTFRCVFEIDNTELRLPAGIPVTLTEAQLTTSGQQVSMTQ